MDKQKILDKLAVIRENVKGITPEDSIWDCLEEIESEIMTLMNDISEPESIEEIIKFPYQDIKLFYDYGKWKDLEDQIKDNIIKTLTTQIESLTVRCNALFPIYHTHFTNIDKSLKNLGALEYVEKVDKLKKDFGKMLNQFWIRTPDHNMITATTQALQNEKKIEVLEEKTIGITNDNYLKRGINLSGVRNIVKEFLEIFFDKEVPSDFKFKQWLEMLEG